MELSICLLILAMLLVAALSKRLLHTKHWINPLTAFNIPHAFLLVAYLLGIRREVFSFTLEFHHFALLLTGYLCFNLAVIALAQVRVCRSLVPDTWPKQLRATTRLMRMSLAVLIACVIYKFWILLGVYGDILANIIAIRGDYVKGNLEYGFANSVAFTASNLLVLMLGVLEGARYRYRHRRLTITVVIVFVIANDITIGGANWTFAALVLYASTWSLTRERLDKITGLRRIAIGGMLAAVAVFAMLNLRSEGAIGGEVSFLDVVLFYAGGDISTFAYFVDFPYPSVPPGRFTLGGLYDYANDFTSAFGSPILHELDDRDFVAAIGQNSNTSIHLASYYCDFGAPGVIVFSALLGFAAAWTMANTARCTVVRIQYCALAIFVCVMSIRGTPTEGRYFWTLLIVLPIAHRLARFSINWPSVLPRRTKYRRKTT